MGIGDYKMAEFQGGLKADKFDDLEAGFGGSSMLYPGISADENTLRWGFIRKVYGILSVQILLTTIVAGSVVYFEGLKTFFSTDTRIGPLPRIRAPHSYVSSVRVPPKPSIEPDFTGTLHCDNESFSWHLKLHGTSADRIGSICFDNHCGGGADWLHLLGCEEGDGLQLFGSRSFHKPGSLGFLRFDSGFLSSG